MSFLQLVSPRSPRIFGECACQISVSERPKAGQVRDSGHVAPPVSSFITGSRHGTDRDALPGVYGTDRDDLPGVHGTDRDALPGVHGTDRDALPGVHGK